MQAVLVLTSCCGRWRDTWQKLWRAVQQLQVRHCGACMLHVLRSCWGRCQATWQRRLRAVQQLQVGQRWMHMLAACVDSIFACALCAHAQPCMLAACIQHVLLQTAAASTAVLRTRTGAPFCTQAGLHAKISCCWALTCSTASLYVSCSACFGQTAAVWPSQQSQSLSNPSRCSALDIKNCILHVSIRAK